MQFSQEKKDLPDGYGQETIDNIQFTVVPFKAIEALRLKSVIMKILIPSIGQLFGGIDKLNNKKNSFQDIEIDGDMITKALERLFSELEEDQFISLIERFLKNTICVAKIGDKNTSIQLDSEDGINQVFQGKLFTIYKVIVLVLRVNYPDFFGLVEGIGSRLQTVLGNYLNQNEEKNSEE